MSKIEFLDYYQNSLLIHYSFNMERKEMRETMSSDKNDQNNELNNNIIRTKSVTFHIQKVKKRNKKLKCKRNEEKIHNRKKNSLIEKKSTNSDTAVKGTNYQKLDNSNVVQFNLLPGPGIFFEETISDNINQASENTITNDIFYTIYPSDNKKKHKYIRKRNTYKDKNTKTLRIDNEHFKNLLKNFDLNDIINLQSFLSNFDSFVIITYCDENKFRLDKNDIFDKINHNYSKLKTRTIGRKYTTDNTFRNESVNCKIINHLLMFCSLILSYLLDDPKIKITIKDKKKKSVDFIKKILNFTMEDLIIKYTNQYIKPKTQNLYIFLTKTQINFFKLKMVEFLPFYFNSNIFKLLIYENSHLSSEDQPYFLDYSCHLIRQSDAIIENYLSSYK